MLTGYPRNFSLGYRPSLDGFRGIAVLLVMAAHGHVARVQMGGGVGVTMFFVLSGFLITALLLEERRTDGTVSFSRFYVRRALRLLPAAAAVLAIATVVNIAQGRSLLPVVFAAFYGANFAEVLGRPLGYLAHMWSLSLEEQFYLLWPVTLLFLLRLRRPRFVLGALVAGIVVSVVTRALVALPGRITADLDQPVAVRLWNGLVHRADALLLGCLLALVVGLALRLGRRQAAIVGGVGWVVLAASVVQPKNDTFMDVWFLLAALASVAIVVHLVADPDSRVAAMLSVAPLRYTGRISYGLYLWHYPIFQLLRDRVDPLPRPLDFLVLVAVVFAVATFSFYVIERPALRLKARLAPRPSPNAPLVTAPA